MGLITRRRAAYYSIVDRPCPRHGLVCSYGRCVFCGHRVPYWEGKRFVQPVPTRREPWRVLAEIVGRFRAMRKAV